MKEIRKREKEIEREKKNIVETICNDRDCPLHGKLKTRGRSFYGIVKKKFPRRVVIGFERMIYNPKYERYSSSKTKLHARIPKCMENSVNVGDYIQIKECRSLSKIMHFVVIDIIKKNKNGDIK